MVRLLVWFVSAGLVACGNRPALESVPRPDPGTAAGVGAAAAAAATLADPDGVARRQAQSERELEQARVMPTQPSEPMPGEVLERLERQPATAAIDAGVVDASGAVADDAPARGAGDGARPKADLRLPPRPPPAPTRP